eukprot:357414-Prymnesium_polylepis.1
MCLHPRGWGIGCAPLCRPVASLLRVAPLRWDEHISCPRPATPANERVAVHPELCLAVDLSTSAS